MALFQRNISLVAIAVVLVATPATLALSYYKLTGDPTFQPLAMSVERLAASQENDDGGLITATIHWDETGVQQEQATRLAGMMTEAFRGKGLKVRVYLKNDRNAVGTMVTFRKGKQSFGPYTTAQVAHGIQAVGRTKGAVN